MVRIGMRGRWLGVIVLLALLAGCGLWWRWAHGSADPIWRGQDAYARGDWKEAASLARDRLKVAAGDPGALRLLARASVRMGHDSLAMAIYHRLGPQAMLPDDLCLLGIALNRDGNGRSLEVWEQARSVEPNHAETLFELTRAYLARDQFAKAAETGRRLLSAPGWEIRAEGLLGAIEMAHNDPAGAIAHWERALEHKGRQPLGVSSPIVVRKQLAGALLQAGRPRDARRQLQIVLGGEPDAEAFWLLSRAYLQEGAGTQALAAWEKARRFREENPLVPEPAPRVGSAVCAKCHSTTFRSQQRSRHSRTFFRVAELTDLNLPAPSIPDPFQPTVKHTLAWSGPELHQETRAEGQIFKAVVEYAFGSGDRGLTLVGRNDRGEARELRLSHYHDGTTWQWDVTTGHLVQPTDIEEYLGRPLTDDSVRRCLVCHVTDPQAVLTASGPLATDRGIGCERCHGPGGNHLLAVAAKFPDLAIADPTTVSGSAVVKLCAQCHSPRGREVLPEELTAVRFRVQR